MNRRVAAFLTLAKEEAGAAEQLIDAFPRQAAYQLQQSVEKVARAILALRMFPSAPATIWARWQPPFPTVMHGGTP